MARARKPKPADNRMAFDFGPAPTSVIVNDDAAPLEQQGETAGPPGAAAMPISGARTSAEQTDVDGSGTVDAQTLPKLSDPPGAIDGSAWVQAEDVTPRRDEVPSGIPQAQQIEETRPVQIDVAPSPGHANVATTDMSERSQKPGKRVGASVLNLMHAAEDAAREATIAALCEAAEIALVRGRSREIHDMIITELRRRFRLHGERIEHHMRLRGLT